MRAEIIPAVLVQDGHEALKRIRLVESFTRWIQIDVLDDTLIKNHSWHDQREARAWSIKPLIELHLMVTDPEHYIRAWKKVKNFQRALWHIEAPIDHQKLIAYCHRAHIQVGLALAPETPVSRLLPFLNSLDEVLILGYEPGWSGQKLMPATRLKISQLKKLAPKLNVGFDGGITPQNLPGLIKRGVNRACVTNAIFKHRDPKKALKKLKQAFG